MIAAERQDLQEAVVGACGELDGAGWQPGAWAALEEIGVTALPVPEPAGGAGADLDAATVVLLAIGSVGASVPVVETGLLAGRLVELAGTRLPDGTLTAALGEHLDVRPLGDNGSVGRRWSVTGTLERVPWARHADKAVVLGTHGGDPVVLVVSLDRAEISPGTNLAGEPRDDVVLDTVPVALYPLDGTGDIAADVLRLAAFGRAALMAGAAQGVYAHAAQYASVRHQFGKRLAGLQAVQQLLAQLAAEASAMTVAAEAAAVAVDRDPARTWPLEAARIRIAGAAARVAAIGHQLHGAIGFTDEHPLHRLTTRLWAWREEYGNQAVWSDRLGAELTEESGSTLWGLITGQPTSSPTRSAGPSA